MASAQEQIPVTQGCTVVTPGFLPIPLEKGNLFGELFKSLMMKMFYRRTTIIQVRRKWIIDCDIFQDNTIQLKYICKTCGYILCDLNRLVIDSHNQMLEPKYYIGNNNTHSGRTTTLARIKRHRRCCGDSFTPYSLPVGRGGCNSHNQQTTDEERKQNSGDNNMERTDPSSSHTNTSQLPVPLGGHEDLISMLDEFIPCTSSSPVDTEEQQNLPELNFHSEWSWDGELPDWDRDNNC